MKKLLFIILCTFIAIPFFSCDDDVERIYIIPERLPDLTYNPIIDPANYVADVTNPYFPLTPGTIWTYEGETEDGTETITVTVTDQTKTILGVICIVVNDVVSIDGDTIEITDDWYAQDIAGNVWYFGEDSQEIEDGEVVSTEGSWEAGVEGAKPGIIMLSDPILGIPYRQEYFFNEAEDWGKVIELGLTVETPFATYTDCIKTEDWDALEPEVTEYKYYAPGIGVIKEEEEDTSIELINFQQP